MSEQKIIEEKAIVEMPVSHVIDLLTMLYVPMIQNKQSYATIPTAFLWGPPGVGKSDGVQQLAERLAEQTGKKVKVTDIRLLLFSPIDLRGVPVADQNKQFTDWLKPRIFDLSESDDVVNILFLDELSAAPQSVQAAAYQLTLNRAIGEHRLPDNTIVIAAGNRVTDRAVAYRMPSALANRMMHFEICIDFESWSKWAVEKGNIHPMVLGYLSFAREHLLHSEVELDEVAYPTPRSWMFVSNILNTIKATDISNLHALISGCIGNQTATDFIVWSKIYQYIPKLEDILHGKAVKLVSKPDALYAVMSALSVRLLEMEKEYTEENLTIEMLDNACQFMNQYPVDYSTCFYRNILSSESIRLKLMKCPAYKKWMKKSKVK